MNELELKQLLVKFQIVHFQDNPVSINLLVPDPNRFIPSLSWFEISFQSVPSSGLLPTKLREHWRSEEHQENLKKKLEKNHEKFKTKNRKTGKTFVS